MTEALQNALLFIVNALIQLGVAFSLLRFIIQAVRADFYNPVTQAIVNITNPVLAPLRKLLPLPGSKFFDYASLLFALGCTAFLIYLPVLLHQASWPGLPTVLIYASFTVLKFVLDIYFFAILILVVASWIAQGSNHPALRLIQQITDPITVPLRRLIPPVSGLDFSVLVAILIITALRSHILPGLMQSIPAWGL